MWPCTYGGETFNFVRAAWAQDPASTEAADVKGVCSKPQLDAARTKLLEAFAGLAVQLPEKLDLRNVSTKEYSMFGGSMSGMRSLNISGDVDASCEPKQSVFLFTAVAQQVDIVFLLTRYEKERVFQREHSLCKGRAKTFGEVLPQSGELFILRLRRNVAWGCS